jgi:predicted permease
MSIIRRITNLFSRTSVDREIDDELEAHIALRVDDNIASGMSPAVARRDALLRFGNPIATRERVVAMDVALRLENICSDVRYAFRQLQKSPGFAVTAILTLALGIGANTAIFTLIHAVLLQSLPVPKPDQLYSLSDGESRGGTGALQGKFRLYSYPLYEQLRDNTPEFDQLAAYESSTGDAMSVRRPDATVPDQYFTELVSGNYFSMFGVRAFAGRALTPSDDQPNAAAVAVMSYRVWRNRFQSDPKTIGQTLFMNGHPVTIIGIMPPAFFGDALSQNPIGFWMPLSLEPKFRQQTSILHRWNQHWLMLIGRLRPGVSPGVVQAKLTDELQSWLREEPIFDRQRESLPRQHIEIIPASGGISSLRTLYAQRLKLLLALSALVLLIASANVANMLMARSAGQRVQVAVQMALGASRARVVQQMVVYGLALAFLGGAGALAVSFVTIRGILLLAFRGMAGIPISPWPSLPVLGFAFVVSAVTGLVFSVVPAQAAARTQPAQPLRGAMRSTRDGSELPQKILVAVQTALSLVLLVATGLLIRSMQNLEQQNFGFQTEGRLMIGMEKPVDQYRPEQLEPLYRNLQQRLETIPGVMSASFSEFGPMDGNGAGEPITIPGVARAPLPDGGLWPDVDHVSANYFATLGTAILRGRGIDKRDTPSARHVAVVNQAFAKLYFPNVDPIGRHFGILEAAHSSDYEIVGVAEDAKYGNPHAPPYPGFYLPLLQNEIYQDSAENSEQLGQNYVGSIQLRVSGTPQHYEQAVRRALADLNPDLNILYVRSFADNVSLNFTQDLLLIRLTMLYGLLSLLLASVGLYGISSYAVARRMNEIGIRMALGADRVSVVRMIIRSALQLTAIGLLLGFPVVLLAGKLLRGQLFGVSATNPGIIVLAGSLLAVGAVIAAFMPAQRAASVDPMQALRAE